MLKYSRPQKRRIAAFIVTLLLAVSTTLPVRVFTFFHSPGAFLYLGLVLGWALTVRSRILQRSIRRLLLYCSGLMLLLFVLRICRYDLFRETRPVCEYALYLYGVCYTMAALLSLLSALCVGRREQRIPRRYLILLWSAETLLCLVMLTNPLHHLFYTFAPDSLDIVRHGSVYLLMVCWCLAAAVASIAVLLVRCRNSFSRNYWFLPAGGFAIGAALLIWYFAVGGAPQIHGVKLFNLQEAVCLTVILPFEAMFRIGLIPTNSDYELFFRRSIVKAAILDESGRVALASPSYSPEPGAGERVRSAPIPGGRVVWFENISELLRLRDELTAVGEELASENELIRQEKELREERIAYETRNRLYDAISAALQPQAQAMRRLLETPVPRTGDPETAEAFRRRLAFALVMGVYLKRMGNLMLSGDGKKTLPVEELALSAAESFEYLRLCGVACALDCRESAALPVPQVLLCYRVFEHFVEANCADLHACMLTLLPAEHTLMRLALDSPALCGTEEERLTAAVSAQGLTLTAGREDDTWFVTLGAGKGAGA